MTCISKSEPPPQEYKVCIFFHKGPVRHLKWQTCVNVVNLWTCFFAIFRHLISSLVNLFTFFLVQDILSFDLMDDASKLVKNWLQKLAKSDRTTETC